MNTENLLRVAAALNVQAVCDLAPIWKVSAIVSPFLDLSLVPPEYDVIVILPAGDPFTGPKGFHFHDSGVAVAVVQYANDWSLFASHELMEMLVDRHGDRTASGPSIKDGQGQVDYLAEIADPCQHSTYTIDGVLVSDFVTPDYYSDTPTPGRRYSFTGRVTQPRRLLDGGYLTWATQAPNQEIWQALAAPGKTAEPAMATAPKLTQLRPASLTRGWIDLHPPTPPPARGVPNSDLANSGRPLGDAQLAFKDATSAAQRNGQAMRDLIEELLDEIQDPIAVDITATENLLKGLTTRAGREAFVKDPAGVIGPAVPKETVAAPDAAVVLPPPERYTEALNAFKTNRFGTDLYKRDLPGLVTWLCQLGGW